jgi:glutaconyl-CoA/methylmalonyl-CoA decarboxylase subunit delta
MTGLILLQTQQAAQSAHVAADEFVKMDPYGIGMIVIALSIVFLVLTFIYMIFRTLGKLMVKGAQKKVDKIVQKGESTVGVGPASITSETLAAIGLALHLYSSQQHDLESMKITIQKVSKMYSPWSSKIYTLREWPKVQTK